MRQSRPYSLADFNAVLVTKYWLFNRLGRTEQEHYYRLALRSADANAANIEFDGGLREADALQLADEIAAFISVPVEQVKGRVEGVVSGR